TKTGRRLMHHDPGVRQRETLTLRARGEQELPHGGGQAHTEGRDIAFRELHGVVDGHPGVHRTTRRVDVERNILGGILRRQQQDLRADLVRDVVVDLGAEEDDALTQQALVHGIAEIEPSGRSCHDLGLVDCHGYLPSLAGSLLSQTLTKGGAAELPVPRLFAESAITRHMVRGTSASDLPGSGPRSANAPRCNFGDAPRLEGGALSGPVLHSSAPPLRSPAPSLQNRAGPTREGRPYGGGNRREALGKRGWAYRGQGKVSVHSLDCRHRLWSQGFRSVLLVGATPCPRSPRWLPLRPRRRQASGCRTSPRYRRCCPPSR